MDEARCSLLVVDDEPGILTALGRALAQEFDVRTAASAEEAVQHLTHGPVDLILCDQHLPGISGVHFLELVRKNYPDTLRLLMTGFAEFEHLVEAVNCGQVFRYILKPWRLEDLQNTLREAARTFRAERARDHLLAELHDLNQKLEKLVRERTLELEEANHQLQQRNLMLEKLALTDPLTVLPNRRALEQLLHNEVRRRGRYPNALTVAMVDVDHFKDVNTRYLHPGGDQVLIALARTLGNVVRSVDTVGRLGGEEFLVVAPMTDTDGASILGERIRQAVEKMAVQYMGQEIRVTASVGLAVTEPEIPASVEQFMHEAAAALAAAKTQGRNRIVVHVLDEAAAVYTGPAHPHGNGYAGPSSS